MALKKDFEYKYFLVANLPWGVTPESRTDVLNGAYIKVVSTEGTKEKQRACVQISSGEKQISNFYEFTPTMSGSNFIAQAYEYLKTLPEFAGAVNC